MRQNHDQTARSICKKSSRPPPLSCKCNDPLILEMPEKSGYSGFFTDDEKKTLIAREQDRPDIKRHRLRWRSHQKRIDPSRLVFIDETSGSSPGAGSGRKPT
jgi:hypothetical protein